MTPTSGVSLRARYACQLIPELIGLPEYVSGAAGVAPERAGPGRRAGPDVALYRGLLV